jgi:hypothetical protein
MIQPVCVDAIREVLGEAILDETRGLMFSPSDEIISTPTFFTYGGDKLWCHCYRPKMRQWFVEPVPPETLHEFDNESDDVPIGVKAGLHALKGCSNFPCDSTVIDPVVSGKPHLMVRTVGT